MFKTDIFCEKNLWPRYVAQIELTALYASVCYVVRLL